MRTEIKTERIARSWIEMLMLWRAAYQTKISGDRFEAIGRGPTGQASLESALAVWVGDWQRYHEANRDSGRRAAH